MFRALLCPSSGVREYNVDYHIGRIVLVAGVVSGLQAARTVRLQPAARTLLQPNRTLHPTYSKARTKRPMW